MKPFHDLLYKYLTHFFIGNCQFIAISIRNTYHCEIPRHIKQTPQILNVLINFCMCELIVNLLVNRLTVNEVLNFHLRCHSVRFFNQSANFVVATGIKPICFWLCFRRIYQVVSIVEYIPRAVYILLTKTISIVPFFKLCLM